MTEPLEETQIHDTDFARTEAALRAYDATFDETTSSIRHGSHEGFSMAFLKQHEARYAVALAFADDTATFNQRADALRIAVGFPPNSTRHGWHEESWLRRIVRQWRERNPPPSGADEA